MNASVSIVTPCFNAAPYLQEAIASLLNQTVPPLEVIVVDDGSTDGSADIARSFGPPVRLVCQENQGPCAARNRGIGVARGDWLLFLDADDLLHKRAIECLSQAITGGRNCLVRMGQREFLDGSMPPVDSWDDASMTAQSEAKETSLFPGLIYGPKGFIHAFLSPTGLVRDVGGFDESVPYCEDYLFWVRMALAGAHLLDISLVGAYYRKHPACRSNRLREIREGRAQVLLQIFAGFLKQPGLLQAYGADLLTAAHKVLRRFLALDRHNELVPRLTAAIQDVERRGFRPKSSIPKRLLLAMLGLRAELAILWFDRFLRPAEYAAFVEDWL